MKSFIEVHDINEARLFLEENSRELLSFLLENNIGFSCCESITGGLFAKTVTDMPGISAVFDRGLVTYSCRAKEEELGVSHEILEEFGAVSMETAKAMAAGLFKVSKSPLCISVTGLAGPNGDGSAAKVGQIYIGVAWKGESFGFSHLMEPRSREYMRTLSALMMYYDAYKIITENN